jgi:hypothetical protein
MMKAREAEVFRFAAMHIRLALRGEFTVLAGHQALTVTARHLRDQPSQVLPVQEHIRMQIQQPTKIPDMVSVRFPAATLLIQQRLQRLHLPPLILQLGL